MKQKYIIGDCLNIIPTIPNNSIDLIVTDPPFNVNINYGDFNDAIPDNDYKKWLIKRFLEFERVLKPGHVAIIFTGDKKIHPLLDAIENTELIFHHFLKWHKPHGQRVLSGLVLFNRTELALMVSKGKVEQSILNRTELYSDTLIYENTTSNGKDDICPVDHPCRRPVKLYMQIINGLSKEGDVVLDPFLGSGTTLLACKLTLREGIGIEINPEYEGIIKERLMENIRTLDAFNTSACPK